MKHSAMSQGMGRPRCLLALWVGVGGGWGWEEEARVGGRVRAEAALLAGSRTPAAFLGRRRRQLCWREAFSLLLT